MDDLARALLSPDAARSTLWLLDGFDELRDAADLASRVGLSSQRHYDDSTTLQSAVARAWDPLDNTRPAIEALLFVLLAQPHVVLTTRPRFREQLGVTHFVELAPLTPEQVETFVGRALAADQPALARLQISLKASPSLAEAVRVPVIMQMAVSVERTFRRADASAASAALSVMPSCVVTTLYERLLDAMRARFEHRWVDVPGDPSDDPVRPPAEVWVAAQPELQRIALGGCCSGGTLLHWPSRDDRLLAALRAARIIDVVRGGGRVEFAHRSVQEFVAAKEVVRRVIAGGASLDVTTRDALVHASNDALRRFAFGLAPDAAVATTLLSALGVVDHSSLPVGTTLELVAACLPHFRSLRDLPLASTVRHAAAAFWAAAARGELQASAYAIWNCCRVIFPRLPSLIFSCRKHPRLHLLRRAPSGTLRMRATVVLGRMRPRPFGRPPSFWVGSCPLPAPSVAGATSGPSPHSR